MIKQKQLFRHNPSQGEYGDCFRTTIACLLNKRPEEVPNFMHGDPNHVTFWKSVSDWLEPQGYAFFNFAYDGTLHEVLHAVGGWNPGMYYFLSGKSPRGTSHQVIALGDRIIHDTAIDGGGLVGPCPEAGVYWVGILVPLVHSVFHNPEDIMLC